MWWTRRRVRTLEAEVDYLKSQLRSQQDQLYALADAVHVSLIREPERLERWRAEPRPHA